MVVQSLPTECLYIILRNLQNDRKSLHSWILLNRLWCRNAMPFLWAKPFSMSPSKRNGQLIQTYVTCLEDVDKLFIDDKGLSLPILQRPLFDYASFLTEIKFNQIIYAIGYWYTQRKIGPHPAQLQDALFNLFIRKNVNLKTLFMDYQIPNISHLLHFSKLQKLVCHLYSDQNPHVLQLMKTISTSCKDIRVIEFRDCKDIRLSESMKDIILSSKHLQKVSIFDLQRDENIIFPALTTKSVTITTLQFYNIKLNKLIFNMLAESINLISLTLNSCTLTNPIKSAEDKFYFEPKFNLKKLKLLWNANMVRDETLQHFILRSVGHSIQKLFIVLLDFESFKIISELCPSNLKELHFNNYLYNEIIYLFKLLTNLNHLEKLKITDLLNIKYTNQTAVAYFDYKSGKDIYESLGESLPRSLKELELGLIYYFNSYICSGKFTSLFRYCKAELETLIIYQKVNYNHDDFMDIINYKQRMKSLTCLKLDVSYINHEKVKELRDVYKITTIPIHDLTQKNLY